MIAFKPSTPPVAAPLNLHAQLAAAAEALLKTRDQVIEALDHHLQELDMLRSALSNSDKPLLSTAPAPALPAEPAIPLQVPQYFEQPPQPAAPVMPLLTQVLWPTKQPGAEAAPMRAPAPAPVAQPLASPPSSPLVAYTSLQSNSSRDLTMDPNLEKATLEELNAALAYAFSHVSNPRNGAASSGGSAHAPANGTSWANSGTQGFGPGR